MKFLKHTHTEYESPVIYSHKFTQTRESLGPSLPINGNQRGNDDWATAAAYLRVADGHALWQLSAATATHARAPPQELFQLSTLAAARLHTRTCWLSASGRGGSAGRPSANDGEHGGGRAEEDAACHFDSSDGRSEPGGHSPKVLTVAIFPALNDI